MEEEKNMEKRKRNERITLRLSEDEKKFFIEKMEKTGTKNMNFFIRKCVMEKSLIKINDEIFKRINFLLSNISNNINQIARALNRKEDLKYDFLEGELKKYREAIVKLDEDISKLITKISTVNKEY